MLRLWVVEPAFTKAQLVHIFCGVSLLSALYAVVRFSHVAVSCNLVQDCTKVLHTSVEVSFGDQVSCSYLGGVTIPSECMKLKLL